MTEQQQDLSFLELVTYLIQIIMYESQTPLTPLDGRH